MLSGPAARPISTNRPRPDDPRPDNHAEPLLSRYGHCRMALAFLHVVRRAWPAGRGRSASLLERRPGEKDDRRFRAAHDRQSRPEVRAARTTGRHFRPGRHTLGQPSDLHASRLLPRPSADAGGQEAGMEKRRAIQDRALGRSARRWPNLSIKDLEQIMAATLSEMTVEEFSLDVKNWLASAKHPRYQRPYTELVYQPMLEVLRYLRATATRPASSPAAARISFASTPKGSTASRRNRWSACRPDPVHARQRRPGGTRQGT